MAKYTVTVVDTTAIQPYIFGSNRLQENIGASELVRLATGQWALEEVVDTVNHHAGQHNVKDTKADKPCDKLGDVFKIDSASSAGAEVIYSGGGNTVIIFSSLTLAREFTQRLTLRILRKAPGLSLVVAHDEFDWDDENRPLSAVITDLISERLAARKASRLPSSPLLGIGITAACESTGLVATGTNADLKLSAAEPTRLISREVEAKLWARDKANQRLKRLFWHELSDWYEFPRDMDNLGRIRGEESYVAVTHADGNGMGKCIKEIAKKYPNAGGNRKYIEAIREFSCKVEEAAAAALRHIVRLLTERITLEEGKEYVAKRVPMEGTFLPFRPLVFGGDDVTFICNGQLGLALTVEYLKAFEEQTESILKRKLHAGAGIAIVKMHYPFARAYALSAQLARSAKNYVWQKYGEKKSDSALDWHIAMTGLSGSLDDIRKREYMGDQARTLLMRPVLLRSEEHDQEGRSWENVQRLVFEFQRDESDRKATKKEGREIDANELWGRKRNKVKALREALRNGLYGDTQAVSTFLRNYELKALPEVLPGLDKYQKTGWDGNRCGYFDAIELLDYYIHLPFDVEEGAK